MATIDISRTHTLSKDDAKKKAEELANSMKDKLGLDWKWADDAIEFKSEHGAAKGAKGEVRVSDKEVRVLVDLPFMLRVMKGTIEDKITEKLKSLLT
jgi:putative polyhydroxyalkanoate system protein